MNNQFGLPAGLFAEYVKYMDVHQWSKELYATSDLFMCTLIILRVESVEYT